MTHSLRRAGSQKRTEFGLKLWRRDVALFLVVAWKRAILNEQQISDRLAAISDKSFGSRDEYPLSRIMHRWAAAYLQHLGPGSRVLDIGAGISPVPLFLAEQGAVVECVDKSPAKRTFPNTDDWNGWGFLDYGRLHPNITAYNCGIEEFGFAALYDAIYSVGCLAHLPRHVREDTFARCRDRLLPGGITLHAIDVIRSSDFLWNRCEGREFEAPVRHGTVGDVADQLASLGFHINEYRIIRSIPDARTDLLLIAGTLR